MPANIMQDEKVVTVGKAAWHNLGYNTQEPMSAKEAHEKMGGSFTLKTLPLGVMFDEGVFTPIPENFAIVRSKTQKDNHEVVFGYVTDHYHIIQPIEIIEKFDEKVGVSISSLGFIGDGRKMFISWEIPSFEVVQGDPIKLYGSVLMGFDSIFSSRLNIGTVRIVCENTFVMSMNEAEEEKKKNRGRGTIYSGKHTNKNLLFELGEWMNHIQINSSNQTNLVKDFFRKLSETKIENEKKAKELIFAGFPDPKPLGDIPAALREKKQKAIDSAAEKAEAIRVGIWDVFSTSRGIAIDQTTCYGLFNAVTQYMNHEQKSKKDASFSIVWGNRSVQMNNFAEVLKKNMGG